MTERAATELARRVHAMLGESLRVVALHDETGTSLIYVRTDLQPDSTSASPISEQRLHEWWGAATADHPAVGQRDRGNLNAVVELFDGAVLVHVRLPADANTAVTLSCEPNVACRLDEFVTKCSTWFETHR